MNCPPPPRKREPFIIRRSTPRFSIEAAISIFGGYPQVSYAEAVHTLRAKLEAIGRHELSPGSLFALGRLTFGKDYQFI